MVNFDVDGAKKRRVVIMTTVLAKALGQKVPESGDLTVKEILREQDLHGGLLDPRVSIEALERAQPKLKSLFDEVSNPSDSEELDAGSVPRAVVAGHALLRLLSDAPHGQSPDGSSFGTWKQEVQRMKKGNQKSKGKGTGEGEGEGEVGEGNPSPNKGRGESGHAVGEGVDESRLQAALDETLSSRGFWSNPETSQILSKKEAGILARMPLSEILKDPDAATKITPSLAMVDLLVNMKGSLEGEALKSAKYLIKRYCDEAMKIVASDYQSLTGIKSARKRRKAEPQRNMANVHIQKTVLRNLHNYDPETGRVMVDMGRMVYKPSKALKDQGRIIICVDQSGSMTESMIHAAIIAAVFATKGRDVRMYIYDTEYVDLSAYCSDPLEVLLKANLGGGTDGLGCAVQATRDLKNPAKDIILWISDFMDNRELLPVFKSWIDMGVTFLPVGPISDHGYREVDKHFEATLKGWQCAILQGGLRTLLGELKAALGEAQ